MKIDNIIRAFSTDQVIKITGLSERDVMQDVHRNTQKLIKRK